jgi:serine/threonine-protein kinase
MGAVYLGRHKLLRRRAAIKVLLAELSAQPDIVNRFFNEARALTAISDPGIVQIFDFGYHTDDSAYIVMELLDGEPMDKRLKRIGRFGLIECLRLVRLICTSLEVAHAKGIVHRDLKPENIFLVADSAVIGGERAKILDFGIAKLSGDKAGKLKTRTGMLIGTPAYMSPEQCRGAGDIDHRSDIYTIACVMFTMLTGRPPFDGGAPGELVAAHLREPPPLVASHVPELPEFVDQILQRCLRKSPAARFQSMAELIQAIGFAEQTLHGSGSGTIAAALPGACVRSGPMPLHADLTTLSGTSGQTASSTLPHALRRRRWSVGVAMGAGLISGAIAFVALRTGDVANPTAKPSPPMDGSGIAEAGTQLIAIDAIPLTTTQPPSAVSNVGVFEALDGGILDAPMTSEAIDAVVPRPPRPRASGRGPRQPNIGENHGSATQSATPAGIDPPKLDLPRIEPPSIDRGD